MGFDRFDPDVFLAELKKDEKSAGYPATAATVATVQTEPSSSVATVATVAGERPQNLKFADGTTAKPRQPAAPVIPTEGHPAPPAFAALLGLCIQCGGPGDRFGELCAYADPKFGQVWLHRICRSFWVQARRPHS